ncbi:hypothetical protein BOX15_Mlig001058g2 [Macrostomum lignano]|uniref:BEN domain-containing protein n=1 Tax=Macrostomum lignano TaxID=282301 RepID=A0A267GIU9_9PLAT|nr:hypothetical protein BOX15_Mlig001058g2 [Macrostomum lignano]
MQKFVILSDAHPAVSMSLADYQESISRASGSATRHLRILMKHFFSQGTLAKSSLTGNGQYKEVLDENLTMGIRDYIQHRYPKLKSAKINLCCTDVCVQARRVIEKQARCRRLRQSAEINVAFNRISGGGGGGRQLSRLVVDGLRRRSGRGRQRGEFARPDSGPQPEQPQPAPVAPDRFANRLIS